MRCLNCLTVVADNDTTCPSCRAKLGGPANSPGAAKDRPKPFCAIIFMVIGGAMYNFCYPPSAAAKAANGIDMQHVFYAGLVGGGCALVGGLIDYLLNGGRK